MKQKIQERINQVKFLATSPAKKATAKVARSFHANDSLSKAIRNSKEAAIFLEELNAAIKVAKIQKH